MRKNWKNIYETSFEYKARIVQAVLKDHGIEGVIVNKKDSAYLFGEVELHVADEDVMRAKSIINKESL